VTEADLRSPQAEKVTLTVRAIVLLARILSVMVLIGTILGFWMYKEERVAVLTSYIFLALWFVFLSFTRAKQPTHAKRLRTPNIMGS